MPEYKKKLNEAASSGNIGQTEAILKYMAKKGIAGRSMGVAGRSMDEALCLAVRNGHAECARLLIEAGADVNAVDIRGDSPLSVSAQKGYGRISKMLIDSGKIRKKDAGGGTQLHKAARSKNTEYVRLLLKAGFDVNAANDMGETPIHCAAASGDIECIKLLLAAGADVKAVTADGSGVIIYTLIGDAPGNLPYSDSVLILKLLINSGAGLDETTVFSGWTALHYAAAAEKIEEMRVLIEAGIDAFKGNKYGEDAFSVLEHENWIRYVKYGSELRELAYRIRALKEADTKKPVNTGYEFDI